MASNLWWLAVYSLINVTQLKSVDIPWAPDNYKLACPTHNIMCNTHLNDGFRCFCYVDRPNSNNSMDFQWYEDYNTCSEIFEIGTNPGLNGVFNVYIDLKTYESYPISFVDFDHEFAHYIGYVIGRSLDEIMILRMFCKKHDKQTLIVQFVVLQEETAFKPRIKKLTFDNVQMPWNITWNENYLKKVHIIKKIESAVSVANQLSLKFYEVNWCSDDKMLPQPTICNTHSPYLACICGYNKTENSHNVFELPFCDHEDVRFYKTFGYVYTLVFSRNVNMSMHDIEQNVVTDIANMMEVPQANFVILRKYCSKNNLHIQIARISHEAVNRQPPFSFNDFMATGLETAPVDVIYPYMTVGSLHLNAMLHTHFLMKMNMANVTEVDYSQEILRPIFNFLTSTKNLIISFLLLIGLGMFGMWSMAVKIESDWEKHALDLVNTSYEDDDAWPTFGEAMFDDKCPYVDDDVDSAGAKLYHECEDVVNKKSAKSNDDKNDKMMHMVLIEKL